MRSLALAGLVMLVTATAPAQSADIPVGLGESVREALAAARPGDRVLLAPGVHYGRVTVPSGVTLAGMRGAQGEWLSILDGSDPVPAIWGLAPEIGGGVWKAQLPYEPYAMQLDPPDCPMTRNNHTECSKTIFRIGADAMHGRLAYAAGGQHERYAGLTMLGRPATYQYRSYATTTVNVPFWDGVEAMFGFRAGTTYLRFRAGDNPNTMRLRMSPGPPGQFSLPSVGVVWLNNATGAIVEHLAIRGGRNGVVITGGTGNTVRHTAITGGHTRVRVDPGATGTLVEHNMFVANNLSSHVAGARTESLTYAPLSRVLNWHMYLMGKIGFGDSSEDDYGVRVFQAGAGTMIRHNRMTGGDGGIQLSEGTSNTSSVYGNTIQYTAGQGILLNRVARADIYENLLVDNGINLRIQDMHRGGSVYNLYRNRFYTPYGEQMYLHGTGTTQTRLALYHNSFSGPVRREIVGSTPSDRPADIVVSGEMTAGPTITIINNIFGSQRMDGLHKVGHVANNLIAPGYVRPGNFAYSPKPWGDTLPDFAPPAQARDRGVALPADAQSLPGLHVPYVGVPDMGALEFSPVQTLQAPTRLRILE